MSSPEEFNAKPAENFEQRMQNEYISPIWDEIEKIESFFTDLDPESELAHILRDIYFEYNTMEEISMDESELRHNLENLRTVVEKLQNPELTENERVSIAIKGIESAY